VVSGTKHPPGRVATCKRPATLSQVTADRKHDRRVATESLCRSRDTHGVDDDNRPPICPRCGVTLVPAALSADDNHESDWVCLECEELDEDE